MPAWPNTLPVSPLIDGFQEVVPNFVLRTDMEVGPAKVRARSTAAVRNLAVEYIMTKAQILVLEFFYLSTLQGGAISFDYLHPRSGNSIQCRFVKPPQYQTTNGNYYKVAIQLEVLP